MVDFRARRPSLEALIAARRKPRSTAENIQTALGGVAQGMNLVQNIQNVVQMRRAAKQRAQLAKQFTGDPLAQAAAIKDPVPVLKLRQEQAIEQQKTTKSFMEDAATRAASIGKTTDEFLKDWSPTRITPEGTVEWRPKKEAKIDLATQKANLKIETKQKQEAQKLQANFAKVVTLFKNTLAQFKGKAKVQGGAGIVPGLRGKLGSMKEKLFAVPANKAKYSQIGAFEGQRFENILALNSILTNQNRVIEGVIDRIANTVIGDFDTEGEAFQKTAQSLRNAFGLMKAMQQEGITDSLNKFSDKQLADPNFHINQRIRALPSATLSPQEEAEINRIIQEVIDVQPVKAFKPTIKQKTQLPSGVTEADIRFTMKKRNMTREQVLRKLGVKING